MKRYLIFAALGPLLGGFLLLFATTYMSGYWTQTDLAEVKKLFVVFGKTLQYSYLFGILPTLMMAAVDDILCHIKRIRPVVRMLLGACSRSLPPNCCMAPVGLTVARSSLSFSVSSALFPRPFRHGWRMRRRTSRCRHNLSNPDASTRRDAVTQLAPTFRVAM